MLVYQKRIGDYKTTGSLFEYLGDDLIEKTVAEKIWALMLELLEFIIEKATIETRWIHD